MDKRVTFNLKNVDGENHTFEVKLFSVRENAKMQLICARPLIKAVGKLAGVIAPAFKEAKAEGAGDVNALQLLTTVDWSEATDALMVFPEMLEEREGPDLVTKIFAHTALLTTVPELEGQPTVTSETIDPHIRQELKDPNVQDAIFGDGNMGEYWQAAAMVLLVNFTRYGRHGSKSLNELVKKLTLGAVDLSLLSSLTQQLKNARGSDREPPRHSPKP